MDSVELGSGQSSSSRGGGGGGGGGGEGGGRGGGRRRGKVTFFVYEPTPEDINLLDEIVVQGEGVKEMLEAYKKWIGESGSAKIVESWPKPQPEPEFDNEVECAHPILLQNPVHLISKFLKLEYPKITGYRKGVIYPSPAIHTDNFHGVRWYPEELRSCKEGSWLNDEIINSGILSAIEFAESLSKGLKSVLFLSLGFFDHFRSNKNYINEVEVASKMKWMKDWKKDWANQINSLLIPINQSNHWTLMVVYPRVRRILHLDSCSDKSIPDKTMVEFLLDCFEAAAENFSWENFSKLQWTADVNEFQREGQIVPQQSDSSSCGIRVLLNCELVIWNLPLTPQAYDDNFVNKVWQYIGVAIVRKRHWLTEAPSLWTT
jgi:hypothetical protein